MLPLLALKFVALSLAKYIPLPVCQTLVEHQVEVQETAPDGKVTTRYAKLLPSKAELSADWRKALRDSGLAFFNFYLLLRFFTNICETVVLVLLIPRAIYGWIRRRHAIAYWMLSVPHIAEPEHYGIIKNLTRAEIVKKSCKWVWDSIKLWDGRVLNDGSKMVCFIPMKKNQDWWIVTCCGKAYAVRVKPRISTKLSIVTFKLRDKKRVLVIYHPGNDSVIIETRNRANGEILSQTRLSDAIRISQGEKLT